MEQRISPEMAKYLHETFVPPVPPPRCRLRGCHEEGEYFLRRQLRSSDVQSGLYCDDHEGKFGDDNLKLSNE